MPANLGDESWAVPEARRTPCSRGRNVCPENPKTRFPLPIHAYMALEERDGGSLTKSDFSIDAGRLELEYLSNVNSLNHRFSVAPHDGLEREFNSFNWVEGRVCTTCAPGDQEKSCDSRRKQASEMGERSRGKRHFFAAYSRSYLRLIRSTMSILGWEATGSQSAGPRLELGAHTVCKWSV